jgi:hypothetical protein
LITSKNSGAVDSPPFGEGPVGMFHKLIALAGRESDIHPSVPNDLYLVSVRCDRAVAHEGRKPSGCLHFFNRLKPDIPEESSVFYSYPILKDIDLCGENEPVDKKDKRGGEEEHERSGVNGCFFSAGNGSVMGVVIEKNSHGNQQNDRKCKKDFGPEFIFDSAFIKD